MNKSTLSLTSALHEVGGLRHAPATSLPGKRPGAHCTGDWVGPDGAGLDGSGLAPTRIRSPDL